ncbi:Uncharacterized conserved protein YdhG, YjbR/CyaY-like superfamily, DUF1801 family [Spirosomataceae bacterium TFI 002]|nr:Uncharacterized conserved protein YdhG, YjbR/CyaY-like superfamily, DUF1801 family [Spirosomataceae bacterium TFI 002]
MEHFENVDDYFSLLNPEQREALEALRILVLTTVKGVEETISYGMPAYKYKGALVYYGAFKKHYSFFPGGIVEQYQVQLKDYKISKGTLQISYKQEAPLDIIKKIILDRVKQNEEKALAKGKKK